MSSTKVAVVEDEEDIREILKYTLHREGYQVAVFPDATSALAAFRREPPTLVLLDLMLPGMDGLELCRILKAEAPDVAIIMVSAKSEESDVILGLHIGADDYVQKPFSPKEVTARVRAVLRRIQRTDLPVETDVLTRGPLTIDQVRFRALCDGEELALTATEFKLLQCLASRPGRVFTRSQLLEVARGEDAAAFERSIDAHIRTVRKKLGEQRDLIETVRSVGYRFAEAL